MFNSYVKLPGGIYRFVISLINKSFLFKSEDLNIRCSRSQHVSPEAGEEFFWDATGWWLTYPSEKYEHHMGIMVPNINGKKWIYGK